MRKALESLQKFSSDRKASVEKQAAKLSAVEAALQEQNAKLAEARELGDGDAYEAARQNIKTLEEDKAALSDFLGSQKLGPTTDKIVKALWEQYCDDYDRDASKKIEKLIKLRKDLFNAFIDVMEMQREAVKDRRTFVANFSEESGITLSRPQALPFKTVYNIRQKSFEEIFSEDLKDAGIRLDGLVNYSDGIR